MNGYSADLKQVCGCSWAATGATSDEVTKKVVWHAKEAHGMNEVPAEIAQKLTAAMRPTM
jgi:predicted small metal-binding protein